MYEGSVVIYSKLCLTFFSGDILKNAPVTLSHTVEWKKKLSGFKNAAKASQKWAILGYIPNLLKIT